MNIDIAHALPKNLYTNHDIAKWTDLDEDFISEKIGVEERYFLSETETAVDLALDACLNLYKKLGSGNAFDNVDALVVVTQTPDTTIPHTSAILQGKLELNDSVASFDISLGCSGYVYALSICKALMVTEGYSGVLLVTSDPYSKILDKLDRNTISIFGDAATATYLQNSEGNIEIGLSDLGTQGRNHSDLMLKRVAGSSIHSENSLAIDGQFLRMNGRSIFNNVMESVPISIATCLKKNNLTLEEIDYFCFHQASKFILEALTELLKIKDDKVFNNFSHTGNTVSSSIPILLQQNIDAKKLSNKRVLICGFGVGLSWGSNVLFFQ